MPKPKNRGEQGGSNLAHMLTGLLNKGKAGGQPDSTFSTLNNEPDTGAVTGVPSTIPNYNKDVYQLGETPQINGTIPNPSYEAGQRFQSVNPWANSKAQSISGALNTQALANRVANSDNLQSTIKERNALDPLDVAKNAAEAATRTKEALNTASGLQNINTQEETRKQIETGKGYYQNAQTGVDPGMQSTIGNLMPTPQLTPDDNTYKMIGRNIPLAYGNNLSQGTIAGLPATAAAASGSQLLNKENEANLPFASTIASANRTRASNIQPGFYPSDNLPSNLVDLYPAREQNITTQIPVGDPKLGFTRPVISTKQIPAGAQPVNVPRPIPPEIKNQINTAPVEQDNSPLNSAVDFSLNNPLGGSTIPKQSSPNLQDIVSKLIQGNQIQRDSAYHVEGKGKQAKTVENEPKSVISNYINGLKESVNKQKPGNRQAILNKISELEGLIR